MSLFCPMGKCKEKSGPCNCEKAMGVAAIAAIAFALFKRFA